MAIHFRVLSQLGVVTVPAGIKKPSVVLILSGVQHIVALSTEPEGSHL